MAYIFFIGKKDVFLCAQRCVAHKEKFCDMSNPYFSFKRFTVWHDRCAMKAGTDSVILGAYVSCDGVVRRILDVGAGCGILSLMMAQRFPEAEITGVEIDVEAACQARENAAASEWAGRIRMENCDFRLFEDECRFDLIVSNPPYFDNALVSPDGGRSVARHSVGLAYGELLAGASRLLAPQGKVWVIVPADAESAFCDCALNAGLLLTRRLGVVMKRGAAPKRAVLSFAKVACGYVDGTLAVREADGSYTEEYRRLVSDFYKNM
jgi:tRNA1Val (adenine37-N6)-methyltransferase